MPTTLTTIRARVRQDLHDEDASNYRWTDAVLDRHIAHALRELSWSIPREQKSTLTTTAGSRDISVSSLTDLLRVHAVEWPTGQYPPLYVRFSLWQTTLTLLVSGAPSGVENVNVYWHQLHTLDGSTSTLPTWSEDLLAMGAAGYAAQDWASFAINRVNVGGQETAADYERLAHVALATFKAELRRSGLQGSLRSAAFYLPDAPKPTQSTDPGP
ncbi:MAG: hypothetical protein HYY02_09435 [Chloroflexi bacterium]|nr:hypothetical protein [Chloroflexota bacterium]